MERPRFACSIHPRVEARTPGQNGGHLNQAMKKPLHGSATDNAYDLTLTVNGTVGSETTPVPVDVLMIVDQSNSMDGR